MGIAADYKANLRRPERRPMRLRRVACLPAARRSAFPTTAGADDGAGQSDRIEALTRQLTLCIITGFRRALAPENDSRVRFSMYAVIKTGGKQYKVAVGEKLKVEQIPADIDAEITLDQVLAVGEGESIQFGTPLVSGASVKATVVSQGRHAKVTIFKMRRRKHYQKHGGHRQNYTELRIDAINA
jgi:large subunit ribosomal protein L21